MTSEPEYIDRLGPLLGRHGFKIKMPFPLSECPPGWLPILDDLLVELRRKGCRTVAQVKQKFGGLRVNLPLRASSQAHAAVEKAVGRAARTCEECGRPGRPREGLRWVQTLCAACWKEKAAARKARAQRAGRRV